MVDIKNIHSSFWLIVKVLLHLNDIFNRTVKIAEIFYMY